MYSTAILLLLNLNVWVGFSQLIGPVGVTTPLHEKTHICNIRDYGGVPDNQTDVSISITKAFEDCVKGQPKSRLVVPPGNYLLKQSIILINGTNWAFQLDGLITAAFIGKNSTAFTIPREAILQGAADVDGLNKTINGPNGTGDGKFVLTQIAIINAVDFEMYSENGLGAIQGQGYLYRISGNKNRARMLRLISAVNSTVHDLLLIDSPAFHFVFHYGINIEVYHLTIRGANLGEYDGIDAVGTNYHIHDNEVTNRDECVSVKSPSHHALVENLVCNQVGSGISIGSVNNSAAISNIHARNISVLAGSSIGFIKAYPGGSGYVTNILWENFRSKSSLYGVNVDQYWLKHSEPNTGAVALSNITFRNFTGGIANGARRPPLFFVASNLIPAVNITVEDFSLWTESGDYVVNRISNTYGTGDDVYGPNNGLRILEPGATPTPYTSTHNITVPPEGWIAPLEPAWAAPSTGYGTKDPIPEYYPPALWKPQGDYDKHYWGSF